MRRSGHGLEATLAALLHDVGHLLGFSVVYGKGVS